MNGVLDSLVHLMSDSAAMPLATLMLSRPRWSQADIDEIEDHLHRAAAATPSARLWLTTVVDRPTRVTQPPRPGRYLITVPDAEVSFVGECEPADGHDGRIVGVLQPLLAPDLHLVPGDRLALGNLYCDAEFADDLSAAGPALIDAFLAG